MISGYGYDRTQVAADTFDASIDSNWENGGGDWNTCTWVSGGHVQPSVLDNCGMRRQTETFANDQYSRVTVQALSVANSWVAAAVRMAAGTDESAYIAYVAGGGTYELYETDSAFAFTQLASISGYTFTVGDIVTMEAQGTLLRLGTVESGGADTQRLKTSDNTITAGKPGCVFFEDTAVANARLTAWSGGDLGALPSANIISTISAQLVAGEWADITDMVTGLNTALDAQDSILEFASRMVWDPTAQRLYFLGVSDPNSADADSKFIRFTDSDGAWTILADPPFFTIGNIVHGYQHFDIDLDRRMIYWRNRGADARTCDEYNLDTPGWADIANITGVESAQDSAATAYFPERGTWVYYSGDENGTNGDATEYDPDGNSWSALNLTVTPRGGLDSICVYNGVLGEVLLGGGQLSDTPHRLESDLTFTDLTAHPVADSLVNQTDAIITYDPATGVYLHFSDVTATGERFYTFDSSGSGTWTRQTSAEADVPFFGSNFPGSPSYPSSVQHAVIGVIPDHNVVAIIQWRDPASTNGGSYMWLYRHADLPGLPSRRAINRGILRGVGRGL